MFSHRTHAAKAADKLSPPLRPIHALALPPPELQLVGSPAMPRSSAPPRLFFAVMCVLAALALLTAASLQMPPCEAESCGRWFGAAFLSRSLRLLRPRAALSWDSRRLRTRRSLDMGAGESSYARGDDNVSGGGAEGGSEPIHVAVTACGNPSEVDLEVYGLLSIKSILMARENGRGKGRAYVFHIITDVPPAELWNTTRLNYEVYRFIQADPLLQARVYAVADLDPVARAAGAPTPELLPQTIFKTCAAARLKLPFLLRDVPRLIYLDWDLVATCDLTSLWALFSDPRRWGPSAFLAMALNDPTGRSEKDVYRTQGLPHPPQGAVSTGVMLWDIARMWERRPQEQERNPLADEQQTDEQPGAEEEGSVRAGAGGDRRGGSARALRPATPTLPLSVVGDGAPSSPLSPASFAALPPLLRQYWETVLSVVLARVPDAGAADFWSLTSAFPLGDQDVLNAVLRDPGRDAAINEEAEATAAASAGAGAADAAAAAAVAGPRAPSSTVGMFPGHPEWLAILPPTFNWCLGDLVPLYQVKRAGFTRPASPCIVHFCGRRLSNAALMSEGSSDAAMAATRRLFAFYRTWPLIDGADAPDAPPPEAYDDPEAPHRVPC